MKVQFTIKKLAEEISEKVTHGKPNDIFSLNISIITNKTGNKINFANPFLKKHKIKKTKP